MRHYVFSALIAMPFMVHSAECATNESSESVMITTQANTTGAKLADGWHIPSKYNFGFGADALVWHPKLDGTYFAYTVANSTAAIPLSGTMEDLPFKWNWGLRVNAFVITEHDAWELAAAYTWFQQGTSKTISAGLNNVVVPLKGYSGLASDTAAVVSCLSAKSQFNLTYQTLVADLKKEYFITKHLSFTPGIGVEAAWIDMTQTSKFTGGNGVPGDSTVVALSGNFVSTKDKTEIAGIGPYFEMSSKWEFYKGFNFFGKGNCSLDFGNFKIKHHEEYSLDPTRTIDLDTSIHRLTPTASLVAGIGYDAYLGETNQFLLTLSLGYEATYWWQVYRPISVASVTTAVPTLPGNLALYGATFHIGLSY